MHFWVIFSSILIHLFVLIKKGENMILNKIILINNNYDSMINTLLLM